jgi:DNA repair protein RecO (recombination protein O)
MPEWNDTGLILSVRPHAETAAIVNILTAEHGRQAGLVRGGQSRKMKGLLQPGNLVDVSWRARLEEHLGTMSFDLIKPYASNVLDDAFRLAGLSSVCSIMEATLPEREPAPGVYDATDLVVRMISDTDLDNHWLAGYVRWEIGMLSLAGYGLGLERCGVTGQTEGLVYVSPRTGVAVTAAGAGEHAPRLLRLPSFLGGESTKTLEEDLLDGIELTGHFLETKVFGFQHKPLPPARARLIEIARKNFEREQIKDEDQDNMS